jgi:hypothetical protein
MVYEMIQEIDLLKQLTDLCERVKALEVQVGMIAYLEPKAPKSAKSTGAKKRRGPLDIPDEYFHHEDQDYKEGFEYLRGKWSGNRRGDYGKAAELWMEAVKKGKDEQVLEAAESFIAGEMKNGGEWYRYVPLLTTWLSEGRYL